MQGRTSSVPFMYFVGEGKNQSEKFKRLKVSGQLPSFSSSRLCYRDPSSKSALTLLPEYSQAPPWLCSVGTQMLRANRVPGGLQPFLPIRSGQLCSLMNYRCLIISLDFWKRRGLGWIRKGPARHSLQSVHLELGWQQPFPILRKKWTERVQHPTLCACELHNIQSRTGEEQGICAPSSAGASLCPRASLQPPSAWPWEGVTAFPSSQHACSENAIVR